MFFAIAVLLIQPQVAPQLSFSAEKIALIRPASFAASSNSPVSESSLPSAPVVADTIADATVQPVAESFRAALPDAPVTAPAVNAPAPMALILAKPSKHMTAGELLAENRRNQRLWRGLAIASHSAATFDAWSTRRSIAAGGQELNPLLKPFAGNASIYAAIQVGPALMNYAGKKLMYSRHSWVRHMWWAPQTASFASSLFSGVHNLGVH
jgi:hypothetical protein